MPRRGSRARKAPAGSTQGGWRPDTAATGGITRGLDPPMRSPVSGCRGQWPCEKRISGLRRGDLRQPGFPAPRTRHDTAVSCRDGHGAGPQRDSEEVPPRATSAARVGRPRQPESGGLLRRCGTDNCGIREKLPTSAIYGRASSHSCNTGIRAISAGRVRHRGGNAVPRVWLLVDRI